MINSPSVNQQIVKAKAIQELARREALRRGLIPDMDALGNPFEDAQAMPLWAWAAKHFFIPEEPGKLILYPYQIKGLEFAMSTDSAGLFNFSTILSCL